MDRSHETLQLKSIVTLESTKLVMITFLSEGLNHCLLPNIERPVSGACIIERMLLAQNQFSASLEIDPCGRIADISLITVKSLKDKMTLPS